MIKTAVIGASGYIGSFLLRAYRKKFPDCTGTGFSRNNGDLVSFDLRKPDIDVLNLVETGHKAVVVSSAAPNIGYCETNPKETYELNVIGTLELVKQLSVRGITTIFFSTDYVFDGLVGNYSDDAETSPITEYGRQKAEVEKKIREITGNYIIFRLSKIYGTTKNDGTLIDLLAQAFTNGEAQTLAIDQFFSPTHIEDVVNMVLLAQEQKVRGLFNLCSQKPYSRYQIASILIEQLGLNSSLINPVLLHSISGLEGRPLNTSLKCSKIFEQLQKKPITVEEAVKLTVKNWIN